MFEDNFRVARFVIIERPSFMKNLLILLILCAINCTHLWAQDTLQHWPHPDSFIVLTKEATLLNWDDVYKMMGFPLALRDAEIEGKVVLRILFDENGNYIRHIVLKDPHPLLTKVFTDVVAMLKVKPSEIDGRPIASWVTIPFDPHFRW